MGNEETMRLVRDVLEAQEAAIQKACAIPTEKLGMQVPLGQREVPLRALLYMLVNHPREHSTEIKKVLAETKGPRASEAQNIVAQARESMGNLVGNFTALDDKDLDRQFEEGRSIRVILQHLARSHQNYLRAIEKALEG
ncbi:MAG: hypothetical protein HYY00_07450 [Chloroflexi bacterium]|nr:hypothetical protein [Chloroflexota bacterium]